MLLPKKIWKDIPGYEGKYQVSNTGQVRSLNYGHTGKKQILKQSTTKGGYKQVQLWKNGKCKTYRVHRLVAMAFIPNPNNWPQVNHKDENKTNNHVSNLEWMSHKDNCNYGTRNKRVSEAHKGKPKTEEAKKKLSESMKGKHPTEETRKKMSEAHTGKQLTEETKKKMSDSHKGENNPMYGKQLTEEHRNKISEAMKGRTPWNKGKKGINKGKNSEMAKVFKYKTDCK